MTVQWLRKLGLGSVVALVAASGFFPGCAENESSLFIYGFKAPSDPPACLVDLTTTGGIFLSGGTLDVELTTTYIGYVLVQNQLVPRGSKDQLRTETSNIQITQAQITIEDVSGTGITSYTVPGTGMATVGDTGYLGAILIDPTTGASFQKLLAGATKGTQKLLVSRVKVFGRTLGGTEIASNEVAFPINVCYGCLITYHPGPTSDCEPSADATTEELPCRIGQDDVVDCRLL